VLNVGAICLVLLGVGYLFGYRRLRRLGQHAIVRPDHKVAFFSAMVSLLPVFGWPLEPIAEDAFSVHILQHVILFCATAPLLSRSRAMICLLWALPPAGRRVAGAVWFSTIGAAGRAMLRRPVAGAALFAASFAFAQFSVFMEWAPHNLARTAAHILYLAVGVGFWWTILAPDTYRTIAHARAFRWLAIVVLEATALAAGIVFLPATDPTMLASGSIGLKIAVAAVSLLTALLASAAGAVWLHSARSRRAAESRS
jgi:cytochrome c oxidase assembly factor CtaG